MRTKWGGMSRSGGLGRFVSGAVVGRWVIFGERTIFRNFGGKAGAGVRTEQPKVVVVAMMEDVLADEVLVFVEGAVVDVFELLADELGAGGHLLVLLKWIGRGPMTRPRLPMGAVMVECNHG